MRNEKGYLEIKQFVDCQKLKKEDEQRRDEAYNAFHFWGLIKKYSKHDNLQERREFLRKFVDNQNRYIALVAMIESLPVSIWRRILWRHNINHESLFSFLRRISPKNMQAIKENYFDLCVNGKQPRILKFYEKWRKKFSVQSLLEEQDDPDLRDKKKGSWSYNFLGLDFGFNAYTGNLNNDELVEAKTWSNFLSIKNHAKDFVVDREVGKYWWLYRTARSNWGWMRNRVVRLSDHICPGFWYTLFVHFLFWIASPLALFHVISNSGHVAAASDLFFVIPVILLALFTPLWGVIAIFWSFFRIIFPLARRKKFVEQFDKFKDSSPISGAAIALLIFLCIAVYLLLWFIFYFCFGSLIGSGLLTGLFILYFGSHIIEERFICFSERSVVFQIIYASAACYIFTLFFVYFGHHAEKIMMFFFSFLSSLGVFGIILALFFLFPIFIIAAFEYFEKNSIFKKILNFSAILVLAMKVLGVFCAGITILALIEAIKATDFSEVVFMSIIMIVIFGAAYFYLMYMLFDFLLQKDTEVEYAFIAHADSKFAAVKHLNGLELRWHLRNNKTWKLLELEDREELLNRAYELVQTVSQWRGNKKAYLKKLLPVLSYAMIVKIQYADLDSIASVREKYEIFSSMMRGMSFEKARKLSREKIKNKEKRSEKFVRAVELFLKPFNSIYEKVSQLIWLKKKFFEICPFIMREGKIDKYN